MFNMSFHASYLMWLYVEKANISMDFSPWQVIKNRATTGAWHDIERLHCDAIKSKIKNHAVDEVKKLGLIFSESAFYTSQPP